MSDPYMPFSNYQTQEEVIRDFEERFSGIYERISDSQLDQEAQKLVDAAYDGFKRLYPEFMSNKAKPQFVVAKSDDSFDATAYQPRKYKDNHKGLMVFTSSFLTSSMTLSAKLGFVAHEMAHLFFWHLDADTTPIRITYNLGKISPAESKAFQNWLLLATVIGWLSQEEANGITFESEIGRSTEDLFEKLTSSSHPSCSETTLQAFNEHYKKIALQYSEFHWDFVFDSPQRRQEFHHNTQQMLSLITNCLKTHDASVDRIDISRAHRHVFFLSGLSKFLPMRDLTFNEFVTLVKAAQAKMREYATQFDSKRLRYYSAEDQADEAAIGVLKILGLSAKDYSQVFLDFLNSEKSACVAALQSGAEPPYGNLIDTHHSPCWRSGNLIKFERGSSRISNLR